jgi:hypothetical protein
MLIIGFHLILGQELISFSVIRVDLLGGRRTAQTLPTGIRIDPAPVNNPLYFGPNSSSNGGTITLKNKKNTQRTISVLPSTGRITSQ